MTKFKSWLSDFKKFITRGNVIDMAVGVIIGTAFTAVVNGLVNFIFMPLITLAIPGGLDGLVTVLNKSEAFIPAGSDLSGINTISYYGETYNADIVNVINWGSFVNAVIQFFIIAICLFVIVKTFAYLSLKKKKYLLIEQTFTKDEIKQKRKQGMSNKQIIQEAEKITEEKAKQKAEEEKLQEESKETELKVLKQILEEIKKN